MNKKTKALKSTDTVVAEAPVKEIIKQEPVAKKPTWPIKDRMYVLKEGLSPLTYTIKSSNIYYFDEEKGYERELKYTTNQKTSFVDEFNGDSKLAHITFEDGMLNVPKSKQTLQKLLSLYHPQRNLVYAEQDQVAEAVNELDNIELEIDALNLARELDVDHAEAILRTEVGSAVSKMTTKELKRDLMLLAKSNPALFISLAQDENVELRSFGIRAVEAGIIKLSPDQRTFSWAVNGRKLMEVPFDEHPYSALASWFKTDEGMQVYKSIEKKFS